jgi:hypothetical protein
LHAHFATCDVIAPLPSRTHCAAFHPVKAATTSHCPYRHCTSNNARTGKFMRAFFFRPIVSRETSRGRFTVPTRHAKVPHSVCSLLNSTQLLLVQKHNGTFKQGKASARAQQRSRRLDLVRNVTNDSDCTVAEVKKLDTKKN